LPAFSRTVWLSGEAWCSHFGGNTVTIFPPDPVRQFAAPAPGVFLTYWWRYGVAKFNAALPGKPINIDTIVGAVAAFERTIEPGVAPFDRWVTGDEAAISDSAKRGFALFAGKATCFVCHSGWRFTDDKFHDIGTTTTDQGRGREVKDATLNFAFKTPT
jgi:hypothetical protein